MQKIEILTLYWNFFTLARAGWWAWYCGTCVKNSDVIRNLQSCLGTWHDRPWKGTTKHRVNGEELDGIASRGKTSHLSDNHLNLLTSCGARTTAITITYSWWNTTTRGCQSVIIFPTFRFFHFNIFKVNNLLLQCTAPESNYRRFFHLGSSITGFL